MSGNKEMPDFDSLSDRVIAEPTPESTFAIKTNLDSTSSEEKNPYYSKDSTTEDKRKLDQYFRNS
jgi:hypothetical protein